ncbi:NAD-dependent succinate-semialdehyde dehydrogenase [Fulvivirga kasyanovii]|uniref:NAD-dependent succinate-semialdehyde dehydrogenase n=1 Tax=Fulvivirga kasyanovii TaxID=396812 RepID=A0ABW9S0F6_9BACT|nr:NAD-dependent succinate-semialdehyde dehydrogenase [Fulvivirga kasyanovii]MTI28910.1 NAD-dependent succinate-semialdehyde dehydrogenase [Fulvivirga kasyanovii]
MSTEVINPATGKKIRNYEELSVDDASKAVDKAHEVWVQWRNTTFKERAGYMLNAARILKEEKAKWGRLMTEEMGKVTKSGIAEAEKCAWVCEYYAQNAEKFLQSEKIETDASKSFVSYQPIGVVLAIMPWNFPFWQVMRFAAPALMAGNAGVLKHASNVPGCGKAIEEIFQRAGFPEHLFTTLLIGSDKVNDIISHEKIRAVTLTGSTPAGKAVAARAGELLKKTVLELGGSDPYVVLEDADLEPTVETCVTSRLINTGQSCIAAKRFIVVKSLKAEFEKLMVEKMKEKVLGDPSDDETDLGPMAREDLRDDLHQQVQQSIKAGAKCLLGGKVPDRSGAYYPATVLTNVKPGMPAYGEELFGPVASIIEADDEQDAIRIANDTSFGLGAAVFTRDEQKGEWIAEKDLEAGGCFVNSFVKSDPRLPFGGIKESGYGRELGVFGIREFVNIKTVYIK